MRYTRVYIDALGYELPPVVVTSAELEARLKGLYKALRIPEGQLEAITGIFERRWWEEGFPFSEGAVAAARHALAASNVRPEELGVLLYGGSTASWSSRRPPVGSPPGWASDPTRPSTTSATLPSAS